MVDIIDEIKDDIKQERYEELVTKHGLKFIYASIILVLAVAIYKISDYYSHKNSADVGRDFYNAFEGNETEFYSKVMETDHDGYKLISAISQASLANSKGEYENSIKNLDTAKEIAKSEDAKISQFLDLMSIFLKISNAESNNVEPNKAEEISKSLENIYQNRSNVFWLAAMEQNAIFLFKNEKFEESKKLFIDISLEEDIPSTIKERANKFIKIIQSK